MRPGSKWPEGYRKGTYGKFKAARFYNVSLCPEDQAQLDALAQVEAVPVAELFRRGLRLLASKCGAGK